MGPPPARAALRSLCLFAATVWLLPAIVLAVCLFGPAQSLHTSRVVGSWVREIMFTFRDAETQWMVYACLAVYVVTFLVLATRQGGASSVKTFVAAGLSPLQPDSPKVRADSRRLLRFRILGNADAWLIAGLLFATVAYAFNYTTACKSTDALTLLGGVVLGKGAAVWAGWVGRDTPCAPNGGQGTARPTRTGAVVVILTLLLLVGALFMRQDAARQYQYRGQMRWSGLWENPNIFGMLMGVGVVLAVGTLAFKRLGPLAAIRVFIIHFQEGIAAWAIGRVRPFLDLLRN